MLWILLSPRVEAAQKQCLKTTSRHCDTPPRAEKQCSRELRPFFLCLYLTAVSVVIWWATVQQTWMLKVTRGTCFPQMWDSYFIAANIQSSLSGIKGRGLVVIHISCSSRHPMCVNTNEGNYLLELLFVRVQNKKGSRGGDNKTYY